jgi:WD40 repeat protein
MGFVKQLGCPKEKLAIAGLRLGGRQMPHRFEPWLLPFLLTLVGGQEAQADSPEPINQQVESSKKTDLFGDPLPRGALARLGTVTGKELQASAGQQAPVTWLSFAQGDKSLVAVSFHGAQIWDLGLGKEPLPRVGRWGERLAQGDLYVLSPDGRTLAVSKWGEKVRFVDVSTGETEDCSPRNPSDKCVGFMPNGQELLLRDREGRTLILWSRFAGREVRRFVGHAAPIRATVISPDGRWLATGSETPVAIRGQPKPDDSIRLWEVATGRERWRLPISSWTLAFSPDGKLLAGGGWDNKIHLWETETGKEIQTLDEPQNNLSQIAFSPDGKTLASTLTPDRAFQLRKVLAEPQQANYGTVRLWEVLTGQERGRFTGQVGGVLTLAFSADGRRLASGGNDTSVLLWDVTGWYTSGGSSKSPDQSLDESWRELGSSEAAAAYRALWRMAGAGNQAITFLKSRLRPVQPAKPEIIAARIKDLDSREFNVRERACQTLESLGELAEPALRQALSEKPTLEVRRRIDRLLSNLSDNRSPERLRGLRAVEALENIGTPEARALLKDLSGGTPEACLTRQARASLERLKRRDSPPLWSPPSHSVTPEIQRLLKAKETTRKDSYRGVLPSRALTRLGPIDPERKTLLTGLSFSPDGKSVMIADGSSTVRLWDRATGKPIREFSVGTDALDHATLSPDGTLLAAATRKGSSEATCCLWDTANGRELRRLPVPTFVCALRFSPDSKHLVTGADDRKARLWDVATGKELRSFSGAEEIIWCIAISPDGKLLAVGERGAVRIWDLITGQLVRRLGSEKQYGPGATSLAFSPNGQFLITGGNGGVGFWETASGKRILQLQERKMGGVFDSAFSPDGRTLATSSWDGQVRLWELATGQVRCSFKGHTDRLFRVAFAPDGREVASGGVEGSVLVWDCMGLGTTEPPSLKSSDMAALSDFLACENAEKAYLAECILVASGQQTVGFLQQHLKPVAKNDAQLNDALARLENQRIESRDMAMNELDRYGSLAEPSLRRTLSAPHSPEAQARIEYLFQKQQSPFPSGTLLHSLRGIEVLEQIGTPEAHLVLEGIASGHPDALLTREAKAAARRLSHRETAR